MSKPMISVDLGPVDVIEIRYRSEQTMMTMPRLTALLAIDGWTDATEPWTSGNCYLSKDKDLHLCINDGWQLERFTDSDIDGVAVGRFEEIDEGEHLYEIMEAIRCAETRTERQVDPMRPPVVKAG